MLTVLDKIKNDPKAKDKILKVVTVLIIIAVSLLALDVFTQSKDGRKQVVDEDGGTEASLCAILEDVEGVGSVDVMVQYSDDNKVTGVIVTAEGAGDVIVKNNLVNGVRAVFNIPASCVMVYEKKNGGNSQ